MKQCVFFLGIEKNNRMKYWNREEINFLDDAFVAGLKINFAGKSIV